MKGFIVLIFITSSDITSVVHRRRESAKNLSSWKIPLDTASVDHVYPANLQNEVANYLGKKFPGEDFPPGYLTDPYQVLPLLVDCLKNSLIPKNYYDSDTSEISKILSGISVSCLNDYWYSSPGVQPTCVQMNEVSYLETPPKEIGDLYSHLGMVYQVFGARAWDRKTKNRSPITSYFEELDTVDLTGNNHTYGHDVFEKRGIAPTFSILVDTISSKQFPIPVDKTLFNFPTSSNGELIVIDSRSKQTISETPTSSEDYIRSFIRNAWKDYSEGMGLKFSLEKFRYLTIHSKNTSPLTLEEWADDRQMRDKYVHLIE